MDSDGSAAAQLSLLEPLVTAITVIRLAPTVRHRSQERLKGG